MTATHELGDSTVDVIPDTVDDLDVDDRCLVLYLVHAVRKGHTTEGDHSIYWSAPNHVRFRVAMNVRWPKGPGHICAEATTCCCSRSALEPDESCPVHGHPWPPRCETCGRFVRR